MINIQTLKITLLSILIATQIGCKDDTEPAPLISCEGTMFGLPIDLTGLTDEQCQPQCLCKDFISKDFSNEQLNSLRDWNLSNPYDELSNNPYDEPIPDKVGTVCALIVENEANKTYRLESFESETAVEQAGAILTHHDPCGLCSTLTDFAVYEEDRDIGDAVRNCGLSNFAAPFEDLVDCMMELGFTKPCAQIWAYNTRNTQQNCLEFCLNGTVSYHLEDGSLNDCLACDEEISGPVFKAVAGRTRRNTGLASSICRPCEEVQPVAHDYPF